MQYVMRGDRFMGRNIFILDTKYPYFGGEPFLCNEIESGVYEGDQVFFCPLEYTGDARDLRCDRLIPYHRPEGIRLCFCVLLGIVRTVFAKSFYEEIRALAHSRKLSFARLKSLIKFSTQAEFEFYLIKKLIDERILGQNKPIVLYAYWMHRHAYIAIRLKKLYPNSVAVARCHGYDLYEYRDPAGYIPYRRYIFDNLDLIFPISLNGKSYLEKNYGPLVSGKIRLSYLGTTDRGINAVRKDERLHIVTCSNIIPLKRLCLIVDALSLLTGVEVEWTHYGEGELRAAVESKAERLLGSNIHWRFAGQVDNNVLMDIYRDSQIDLFINVSETEGLPVSIMEVMSFGVPVIATDVGGTSEIVHDGENGFLLPKDLEPKDLAERIVRFTVMTPEERAKFRNNARAVWSDNFNAEMNYQRFYHALEMLWEERKCQDFM